MTFTSKEHFQILHEVEHYRQRYNWDCGVSCVMMLLASDQRETFLRNFTQLCTEEGFGQSIWTIDLCYLLKRFGIKHHMYTTMLGVNEAYRKHSYYNKIIDLDRGRVQKRFEQASTNLITVTEMSVSTAKIVKHVRECGPVILLVDAGLLVCDFCKHNKLKAEFRFVTVTAISQMMPLLIMLILLRCVAATSASQALQAGRRARE